MTFHGRQLGAVIFNINVRIFNVLPDKLVGGNIFRKSSKLKIKVEDCATDIFFLLSPWRLYF